MSNFSADLYQALAEVLAEPPEWMSLPGCEWPLFDAVMALVDKSPAAQRNIEALTGIPAEPLDVRRNRYATLLNPKNGIWLYETAALYGRIIGDDTFALARLYQAAGLQTVGAELPDHISIELAFLAFLVSNADATSSDQQEKLFLQQHAGRWMPALGYALANSSDPVYGPIGSLLADWLSERALSKRDQVQESDEALAGTSLPTIPQLEDCTLCGFCSQVCPTHVLTMRENEHETLLILRNDLTCTSCNKCAEICETKAIQMVSSENPRIENTVLMRSERQLCKRCQKPMISTAELAYMARQLGSPDWLNYCLDCRPLLMQS